jgi:hypothetical protein
MKSLRKKKVNIMQNVGSGGFDDMQMFRLGKRGGVHKGACKKGRAKRGVQKGRANTSVQKKESLRLSGQRYGSFTFAQRTARFAVAIATAVVAVSCGPVSSCIQSYI